MVDFGSYMPAGAKEAKDRQDRKDADWDAALEEEMAAQLEELIAKLAIGDGDAIQAVADQLCPVKIVEILCSTPNFKHIRIRIGGVYKQSVKDAAEIMAINKLTKK